MKEVDITPLFEIDEQFRKAVNDVEEKFKGDWNDSVHDSYRFLNSQLNENASVKVSSDGSE